MTAQLLQLFEYDAGGALIVGDRIAFEEVVTNAGRAVGLRAVLASVIDERQADPLAPRRPTAAPVERTRKWVLEVEHSIGTKPYTIKGGKKPLIHATAADLFWPNGQLAGRREVRRMRWSAEEGGEAARRKRLEERLQAIEEEIRRRWRTGMSLETTTAEMDLVWVGIHGPDAWRSAADALCPEASAPEDLGW